MPPILEHLRSLSRRQKLGILLAWALSLMVTAASAWAVAWLVSDGPPDTAASSQNARPDPGTGEPAATDPDPSVHTEAPVTEARKEPPRSSPSRKRTPKPIPPEPAPEPAVKPVIDAETPEPSVPPLTVTERATAIDLALDSEDPDSAVADARAILDELGSFENLTAALADEGAGELRAHLMGLRVLQGAGYEEICRDVARTLRRGYAGTPEVGETIRGWKILRPFVSSSRASIVDDRYVSVTGTLENPDVVSARKVEVAVEALDAAGNQVGVWSTRARPKRIGPEGEGSFKANLKGIDPSSVVRTRVWVLEYEYEVLEHEYREPDDEEP